jgi:hypothetical protein
MGPITVAATRDRFVRDGRPFFYLADTCWSAFTNVLPGEWEQYLDLRAAQGFNALQITILPQWDRSKAEYAPPAFKQGSDGRPDFGKPEDAYFEKASRMLAAAAERGIVPALVLLWCDRIRDTWACRKQPENEMPLEAIEPFIRYAARVFGRLDPVWLVSGDTDMRSPETVKRYLLALKAVKAATPGCLTTLHLQPDADLPPEVVQAPELDFYMYQSGHNPDQSTPYVLARRFLDKPVKRPVVNGEPCYDGHGFGRTYGRFGSFHVRKAIWQSLLAGAKAGVTYGAHGVWNWHRRGLDFGSAEFSGMPLPWHEAARLPGALDASFARWVFETFGLADVEPVEAPEVSPEIRIAENPRGDLVAAYVPWLAEVRFQRDLSRHEAILVNLADRSVLRPVLRHGREGSALAMPDVNADVLFVARAR